MMDMGSETETKAQQVTGIGAAATRPVEKPNPRQASILDDIDLQLTVELGRTMLPIREVLKLGSGSVIDLAKSVGDPVSILANGKPIALGELVVVDSALAVRITEIVNDSGR